MAESRTKKNKKKKKSGSKNVFIILGLFVVAAAIALYFFAGKAESNLNVETVLKGTAEDKAGVTGYLIREENVINAPESGVISYRAAEGERVAKGSSVAVIFSGEVSDEIKSELSSIHQRINDAKGSVVEKNLFAGDVLGGASQIENDIDMISAAVYTGNVSNVTQYKDDLIRIIRKDTGEESKSQTTLEKLEARRVELESSISGQATGVYATEAGVMCSQIDGYEEYFSYKNIENITPSYLKNTPEVKDEKKDTVEKGSPCLKIINNYEWYFAAEIDEDWVSEMKVGNHVSIRFTDISMETMDGTIYRMSEPENGKVAVVVKSRSLFTGMYTSRELKAEIIRKTYRGFKISKDAVHIDEDGSFYVFVNSEGAARRRNVTILYSDDAYVIIKEDNAATNNILLYDEVLISNTGIKEGKTL